jgi:hypothetical protein
LVVEASDGQLEDEIRLAMHHVDIMGHRFHNVQRQGGFLPESQEVYDKVKKITEVSR